MNIKLLNNILFGITILITILFAIISKLIFSLIFIPVVYNIYVRSKEYLDEKNLRYDLFKVAIYKYIGIIYIFLAGFLCIMLNIQFDNILTLLLLLPGVVCVCYPYIKSFLFKN